MQASVATEAYQAVAPSPSVSVAGRGPADAETMTEVLRELQTLDRLTPEQQQRLLNDLKGHESSAWPQLVRNFRDALPREPQLAAVQPAITSQAPKAVITGAIVPVDSAVSGAILSRSAEIPVTPATVPASQPNSTTRQVIQATATIPSPAIVATAPAAATVPSAPPAVLPAMAAVGNSPGDWRFHLATAIGALEAHAAATPDSTISADEHARLRLLYLAAGRRDDALRPMSAIAAEQQDFWSKELTGLATYLDAASGVEPTARAAEAATYFEAAQKSLREQAGLTVRNLTFCTEVTSYGVYQPFAATQFAPGQEVLLYAEIENLKSEHRPDGYYTALDSSYELVDSQGKSVDARQFGLTQETCRNERRDFFIRYQFFLPKGIADGAYTLRLKIQDTLGQKLGQATIALSIKQK